MQPLLVPNRTSQTSPTVAAPRGAGSRRRRKRTRARPDAAGEGHRLHVGHAGERDLRLGLVRARATLTPDHQPRLHRRGEAPGGVGAEREEEAAARGGLGQERRGSARGAEPLRPDEGADGRGAQRGEHEVGREVRLARQAARLRRARLLLRRERLVAQEGRVHEDQVAAGPAAGEGVASRDLGGGGASEEQEPLAGGARGERGELEPVEPEAGPRAEREPRGRGEQRPGTTGGIEDGEPFEGLDEPASRRPARRRATPSPGGGPPRRAAACARPKAARSRASGAGVKTAPRAPP